LYAEADVLNINEYILYMNIYFTYFIFFILKYSLLQVEFMTYAFGGPEEYHGKNMWKAHEKLVRDQGLNDNHFDIIVKHLVGALQKFNVPEVI